MDNKKTIQLYINNFRRHLSQFLKPNIGLSCNVYPTRESGAILEFTIGPGVINDDEFLPAFPAINVALSQIKQNAFGGNLKGFVFKGTNVITDGDRIILIKGGDSKNEWSDKGAYLDAKNVLFPPKGGER